MKKLLSIAILFCGLMLGKLWAEERLFQQTIDNGAHFSFWNSGETDKINYYLTYFSIPYQGKVYGADSRFIFNGIQFEDTSRSEDDLQIKDSFVCSGDTLKLLGLMIDLKHFNFSKASDSEQIQRSVNRWLRNANIENAAHNNADNHYRIEFGELYPMYCPGCYFYDYVAGFNLLEKMKLSLPKKYDRIMLNRSVIERLAVVANGGRFDNGELGYKTKLDDNALEDLYYEFRDFGKAKMKELSTLKINHTKKLLENTCAPVEKFSYKRYEAGGILGVLITFDETRVKSLEDLNPTPQLFQFIPEQERKFIDTTSTN